MAVVPTARTDLIFRVVGLCRRFDGRRWSLEVPSYEYYDGSEEMETDDDTEEMEMRGRLRERE
jgi:hypothetical protein